MSATLDALHAILDALELVSSDEAATIHGILPIRPTSRTV